MVMVTKLICLLQYILEEDDSVYKNRVTPHAMHIVACSKMQKKTARLFTNDKVWLIPFRLFLAASRLDSCHAVVCKYHEPTQSIDGLSDVK